MKLFKRSSRKPPTHSSVGLEIIKWRLYNGRRPEPVLKGMKTQAAQWDAIWAGHSR